MKPRLTAALAIAAVSITMVTGCSSDDKKAETPKDTTSTSAAAETKKAEPKKDEAKKEEPKKDEKEATPASGTVTITHALGTDTYPVNPKNVVAIGQTAVDNLLSIGIVPTTIVGSAREKNIPWQGAVKDVNFVEVANFKDFQPEKLAETHPDLIVGDAWRVTAKSYPTMKQIAPTIGAASKEGDKIGWVQQVENLGKIFGKEDVAKKAIEADQALFAKAREDMPGLKGKTGIASQYIGPMKAFGVVSNPRVPANQFFIDLGMSIPDAIVNAPNQDKGRVTISPENISMLNADFMIIGPRGATADDIKNTPGFSDLKQVKSGAYRMAEKPSLLQAVNQPSALSRAYALKELTPELKIAAGEK